MKKFFISTFLMMMYAIALNAQPVYLIDEDFSTWTLQTNNQTGTNSRNAIPLNYDRVRFTDEGANAALHDWKTTQRCLRMQNQGGTCNFTIPANTGTVSIRIHAKGLGSSTLGLVISGGYPGSQNYTLANNGYVTIHRIITVGANPATITMNNNSQNNLAINRIQVAKNSGDYWINDDFLGNLVEANYITNKSHTSLPEDICLSSGSANFEDIEHAYCNDDKKGGQILRLQGAANCNDNGNNLTFTVPNAGTIRIALKAKSGDTGGNARTAKVFINGEELPRFVETDLNRNTCHVYSETINSGMPVTVKIVGYISTCGTEQPICVNSIQVTKYPKNPILSVSQTTTLTGLGYVYGEGASAIPKEFTVSGSDLAEKITVSLPAGSNYEISKSADGVYSQSVEFDKNGSDAVATSTVYVRLKVGLDVGTYNHATNDQITVSTRYGIINTATPCKSGITETVSKNFNLSGEVTAASVESEYRLNIPKNQTVSFSSNNWEVRYGDNLDWESALVTIPVNDNLVQKITIVSGKATVPAGTYKTGKMEISENGGLDVATGTLTIAEELVLVSADNAAAQLAVTSGTLSVGKIKVKKAFRNTVWYMVSFPFDIEKITRDNNDNPITVNSGSYVYARRYGTEHRDVKNSKEDINSSSWIDDLGAITTLEKNKGYLFGQAIGSNSSLRTTLIFTASNATANAAFKISEKSFNVVLTNGHELHKSWNLIGNPNTLAYNLNSLLREGLPMPTYVYNIDADDYEEGQESIEPFKAFFVQAEAHPFGFVSTGAFLRSSSNDVTTYDEIKLGISKDASFTDWYRIRLTDHDGVTDGYDFNIDAMKMISTQAPQIYRSTSYVDFAVDVMPRPDGEKTLSLSYKTPSVGTYTISYEASNLSENVAGLWLVDKKENSTTDLLLTPSYSFTSAGAETVANRFDLVFELLNEEIHTSAPVVNSSTNGIVIISAGKKLVLRGLNSQASVTLFDITGRKIAAYANIDNNQLLPVDYDGILIVKVENENQSATAKVIIK